MTLDFFLLIERQLFEYHLVTELMHVSSLCFSNSTLSADAYMITSSAYILRTHPSSVKLEISLMNIKNKMGPSTDPCGTPFFISRYSDVSCWNETSCPIVLALTHDNIFKLNSDDVTLHYMGTRPLNHSKHNNAKKWCMTRISYCRYKGW